MQEDDEFVVIATDGLFDVIGNQEAVNFIKQELSINKNNLDAVVKELVHMAIKKGSVDNVSVIVVAFHQNMTGTRFSNI